MPPNHSFAPRVYTLLPAPDPADGDRPLVHAPNPNLSWVTAVLVVLCIVSLTIALATVYVFAALRNREADVFITDQIAAGGAPRHRDARPRWVEGVAVRQPSGSMVAGVPAECAV